MRCGCSSAEPMVGIGGVMAVGVSPAGNSGVKACGL